MVCSLSVKLGSIGSTAVVSLGSKLTCDYLCWLFQKAGQLIISIKQLEAATFMCCISVGSNINIAIYIICATVVLSQQAAAALGTLVAIGGGHPGITIKP